MIGRVEIKEILGMVATLSLLLVAGFAVQGLEADTAEAWSDAGRVAVTPPELPGYEEPPLEARIMIIDPVVPAVEAPPVFENRQPSNPTL
jgi:hypothetical protein